MARIFVALLVFALTSGPVHAAGFAKVGTFSFSWEETFTGARQTALGHADLAGAYGPGAILINPAPRISGDAIEVEYGHNNYASDIDLTVWGAATTWRGWRLGFCRNEFNTGPQLIRTAYNPEGTGETFEVRERMDLVSLGYDLGRHVSTSGRWSWTIGVAHRRYATKSTSWDFDRVTWDVGTTAALVVPHEMGEVTFSAALAIQNLTDRHGEYDEREVDLPGGTRMGFTVESTFGEAAWGGEAVRVLAAISHRSRSYDGYEDRAYAGLEVTGAGLLAIRAGTNSRWENGFNSWGAGLILDRPFMGPLKVTADYGRYDMGYGEYEVWSLSARYAY